MFNNNRLFIKRSEKFEKKHKKCNINYFNYFIMWSYVFTVSYAKNNSTQNNKDGMSQNGGTPPDMPSGNN